MESRQFKVDDDDDDNDTTIVKNEQLLDDEEYGTEMRRYILATVRVDSTRLLHTIESSFSATSRHFYFQS